LSIKQLGRVKKKVKKLTKKLRNSKVTLKFLSSISGKGWDQYFKGSLAKLINEGMGLPQRKSLKFQVVHG